MFTANILGVSVDAFQFRFHTGSIKSQLAESKGVNPTEFAIPTGSIKRCTRKW